MMGWVSLQLLTFAVCLYTRLNVKRGLSLGLGGWDSAEPEVFAIDNGKRMVKVTIVHGPFWSES